MSKENISVLHFARWYPNRYDPMFGLFIQRHAEAVALYARVGVVYVHAVADDGFVGNEVCYSFEKDVHTVRVYYPVSRSSFAIVKQILGLIRFYTACNAGRKRIHKEIGLADVIHIHILSRLGFFGLLYKWKYHLPFVVSEHWSRYLDRTGNYHGAIRKLFTRLVVRNASLITTVTQNLAKAMQRHKLTGAPYQVLANVVDPVFFRNQTISTQVRSVKTLIHVSCFEDKSKNISGLLRAVKLLSEKRSDFKVVLVGDGMDFERMKTMSHSLGISPELVEFKGLLQGEALVTQMKNADMLLVTSNYENLPVVIIEGFVLGIPVLATRVGGIAEVVDSTNGVLINPGNDNELVNAMNEFLDGKRSFDPEIIKEQACTLYTDKAIGKNLMDIYSSAIKKNSRQ